MHRLTDNTKARDGDLSNGATGWETQIDVTTTTVVIKRRFHFDVAVSAELPLPLLARSTGERLWTAGDQLALKVERQAQLTRPPFQSQCFLA